MKRDQKPHLLFSEMSYLQKIDRIFLVSKKFIKKKVTNGGDGYSYYKYLLVN